MEKLTKQNIASFLEYYHGLHDSSIKDIVYKYQEGQIEIFINVYWSGNPILKKDGTYETNKTQIHLIFKQMHQFFYKEIEAYDYIDDAYIKYVKIDGEEWICFASDQEDPQIYIVCKEIEYEDFKEQE